MNSEPNKSSCCQGPFLPVLLIGLSLVLTFAWQIKNISDQHTALQNSIQTQTATVDKSKKMQSSLESIAVDLLQLAKDGDSDAKAIVSKYNISQAAPAPQQK
jgi:hypothetical protein